MRIFISTVIGSEGDECSFDIATTHERAFQAGLEWIREVLVEPQETLTEEELVERMVEDGYEIKVTSHEVLE